MRSLTVEEINVLKCNGCFAEDWADITVDEDFSPEYIHNVAFYGEVTLGLFEKAVTLEQGFSRHAGIYNATLRNTTVGDNCLIENVGNYINNYEISDECVISNVGVITADDETTFGQGNKVAVLNEAGDANVIIYDGLTSQMAALMMMAADNRPLWERLHTMVNDYVSNRKSSKGLIGYRAKITNTREINNTWIDDDCEINGASCISETTLKGMTEASVFIGHDVICKNSVVMAGASVLDGAKIDNCFVGEACHVGRGFSAESSIFFANSYMDNGEACAAFCGPFSVSHHKASLLIGVETSFYNAGSATNFSNHAYKMGPIHYGSLQRGSKTASGAHILMPAQIGAFSMCMGKIQSHPHSTDFPFSYVIADGATTWLVPGCNLATVGTYRDITKWPRRDKRPANGRSSVVNSKWLNPFVIQHVVEGKKSLTNAIANTDGDEILLDGCTIKYSSAQRGIGYYDMAIRMFLGETMDETCFHLPSSTTGTGEWLDLSGLLAPKSEIEQLTDDILEGVTTDIKSVDQRLHHIHNNYSEYVWNYAYSLALTYYNMDNITEDDIASIVDNGNVAHETWIKRIAADAEKEFAMGDVAEQQLNDFLESLK